MLKNVLFKHYSQKDSKPKTSAKAPQRIHTLIDKKRPTGQ